MLHHPARSPALDNELGVIHHKLGQRRLILRMNRSIHVFLSFGATVFLPSPLDSIKPLQSGQLDRFFQGCR